MRIKKFLIFILFTITTGYTGYSLYTKFTQNKFIKKLPHTIFLRTERGQAPFKQKEKNIYCHLEKRCALLQNITTTGFDFIFDDKIKQPFVKKEDNIFATHGSYFYKTIFFAEPKITFEYKYKYKTQTVTCLIDNSCYIDNKKQPFQFIAAVSKTKKDLSFDELYTDKNKDILILKNKNSTLILNKKDNSYQQLTPSRTFQKPKRFLLLLSSYKRPVYLSNLIARLNTFNYDKKYFDISVSLKGVSPDIAETVFLSDFEEDVKQGHLFFRTDKNTNQFTNLLNTYRDIDLKNYDYLLKIDDDDWYHKDYLKMLNIILSALNNPEFIISNDLITLLKNNEYSFLKRGYSANMGSSVCMSTKFATQLLKIETLTDSEIEPLITKDAHLSPPFLSAYEDRFINALAHNADIKYIYFTLNPLFIYNRQNVSITRF